MRTFGSTFSGIGGMDLGLERAGWRGAWQVEIDGWRRRILERHWPGTPRWGDIRGFPGGADPEGLRVDLVCGGFPCQDLSVAGRRAGLGGERSGLFFEFARVVSLLQPRWVLVENVPGLLSSNAGEDMGVVVEALSDIGYGLAWRVLDSQHFGVPQRRRRVYVVGRLGAPCPPEVLFEPEGGGGDTEAGREAGQDLARPLAGSATSRRGFRFDLDSDTYVARDVAWPLRATRWGGSDSHGDEGNVALVPVCPGGDTSKSYWKSADRANTVTSGRPWQGTRVASRVAGSLTAGRAGSVTGRSRPVSGDYVCEEADPDGVREAAGLPGRLDPCPRCADGARYAALGDANTVPVVEWIGRRMLAADTETEG